MLQKYISILTGQYHLHIPKDIQDTVVSKSLSKKASDDNISYFNRCVQHYSYLITPKQELRLTLFGLCSSLQRPNKFFKKIYSAQIISLNVVLKLNIRRVKLTLIFQDAVSRS